MLLFLFFYASFSAQTFKQKQKKTD